MGGADDFAGNLRVGPTTAGMVRISVEAEGTEWPLDFDPEDAEEIAEELRAAAEAARRIAAAAAAGAPPGPKPRTGPALGPRRR